MSSYHQDRQDNETPIASRVETLFASITHAGKVVTTRVDLPGTPISIKVTRPTDINLLLDQVAADPEQNLPYWAEIWPSGIALAAAIAQRPQLVAGRDVLELGCGLGITATQAVDAGARLTISDYSPEALALARITCLKNAGHEPAFALQLNWRSLPMEQSDDMPPFPVVLAADVLYEQRDVDPLIEATNHLVAANGLLWLAEPGRPPATMFIARLRERGWRIASTRWEGPWPDPNDADIVVHTHLMQRPPG